MITYNNKRGLSLIEIMMAVAIIAILAVITIGIVSHIDKQRNEKLLTSTFALLDGALGEYYDYWKTYPDPNKPLYSQLRLTPGANAYIDGISEKLIQKDPNLPGTLQISDPWGKPLVYRYIPAYTFPKLVSAGPDKIFGTIDDIPNK